MRLIFAGTPEFAQVAMAALHAAGHEIVLVLTQPDRPAGRGMKLQPSPVKQWALDHAVPVASRAACGWTANTRKTRQPPARLCWTQNSTTRPTP
jgi:methionyl-tRNA formyltransferase